MTPGLLLLSRTAPSPGQKVVGIPDSKAFVSEVLRVASIQYIMFYSLASRYVHGSGDWLHELTRSASADVHVSYSQDLLERKVAMFIACGCMVEMLRIVDGCLKIPIKEQVASVAQEYNRLAKMGLDEVVKRRGVYVRSDEYNGE